VTKSTSTTVPDRTGEIKGGLILVNSDDVNWLRIDKEN